MLNGARQVAARQVEDALVYLPHRAVVDYRRGQVIYDESQRSNGIYLVVRGRVKASVPLDNGSQPANHPGKQIRGIPEGKKYRGAATAAEYGFWFCPGANWRSANFRAV